MRIAEYKQITRMEQHIIHHDALMDAEGNVVKNEWDETVEVKVPVMDVVYRDMTSEEEEKMLANQHSDADGITYEQKVSYYIREKYSLDDELAILRQRDEKPDEYAAYYAYAEECKARARELTK